MKKMNRMGYLTVDVILASVVTVAIAVFLMEITIKLVNITDDEYVNTELMTDKALIIKNVKKRIEEDIKDTSISDVDCSNNGSNNYSCIINYNNTSKELRLNANTISYNDYSKELNSGLYNIELKCNNSNDNDYYDFYITADNKFSKDKFRIDIIIKNS